MIKKVNLHEIQIPKDFSGQVDTRECNGDFPLWKVDLQGAHVSFPNDPPVCEGCFHIEACRMYISQILLMGKKMSRDEFNGLSQTISMYRQFGIIEDVHEVLLGTMYDTDEDD